MPFAFMLLVALAGAAPPALEKDASVAELEEGHGTALRTNPHRLVDDLRRRGDAAMLAAIAKHPRLPDSVRTLGSDELGGLLADRTDRAAFNWLLDLARNGSEPVRQSACGQLDMFAARWVDENGARSTGHPYARSLDHLASDLVARAGEADRKRGQAIKATLLRWERARVTGRQARADRERKGLLSFVGLLLFAGSLGIVGLARIASGKNA